MKRLTKKEADEVMDLEYIECDCGFHLGLDNSYLDQLGDIKIHCPNCDALIDTAVVLIA